MHREIRWFTEDMTPWPADLPPDPQQVFKAQVVEIWPIDGPLDAERTIAWASNVYGWFYNIEGRPGSHTVDRKEGLDGVRRVFEQLIDELHTRDLVKQFPEESIKILEEMGYTVLQTEGSDPT